MTSQALKQLDRRLDHFLGELTEPMGRSERAHWARVYVQGLLLDGQRKSVEPIAERISGADVQALRQFLSQSPWEVAEVQRRLALKVVDTLSEPELWIRGGASVLRGLGQDRQLPGGGEFALERGASQLSAELAALSSPRVAAGCGEGG